MKTLRFGILLLPLMLATDISAQKGNLTAIYVGVYDCGNGPRPIKLTVAHYPDQSLRMMLWDLPIKSTFKGFNAELALHNPMMLRKLVVTPVSEKLLKAKFVGEECKEFQLKRDSDLSKPWLREFKNSLSAVTNNGGVPDLSRLAGVWIMQSLRSGEEYRLIFENDQTYLQILGSQHKLISLSVEEYHPDFDGSQGMIVFRLAPSEAESVDFDKIRVTIRPRDYPGTNFVLKVEQRLYDLKWRELPLFSHTYRLLPLSREPLEGSFNYEDWQRSVSLPVSEPELTRRLRKTMTELGTSAGWRCLSQRTITVSQGERTRLAWENLSGERLYLIYSPHSNGQLIYKFTGSSLAYFVGPIYDYPYFVVQANRGLYQETGVTFSLPPKTPNSPEIPDMVTVTVFQLFRGWEFGRTNCSY